LTNAKLRGEPLPVTARKDKAFSSKKTMRRSAKKLTPEKIILMMGEAETD